MKRGKLLPAIGQRVAFSGFFKGLDRRNILFVKRVRINGHEFHEAWLRRARDDTIQPPKNALISGTGVVTKYSREDGSEDLSLDEVEIDGVRV